MQIYINNKLAAIKQGSSFDFVSENRYFSGADSYSLAITVPLKDCPQNLAIFGHINRKDIATKQIIFDCEIRDKSFVHYGSITITEINEVEVKCQYLEGQSVNNYDVTFDEFYINELELGYPVDASNAGRSKVLFPATNLQNTFSSGQNWQALPWVNNNSGNLQNKLQMYGDGSWHWHTSTPALSFQPYIIYIIEKIFEVLGYSCDFTTLRNSRFRDLLVCNTLPSAWNIYNFAKALPHWTLTEFIEQLELLFNGFFEIDSVQKTVSFSFTHSDVTIQDIVTLRKVVNDFTCKCETNATKSARGYSVKYADCDHRMWKYYSCQFFIDKCESGNWIYRPEDTVDSAISFMDMDNSYPQYTNLGMLFRVGTQAPYTYYMERTRKVEDADNNKHKFTYGMQRLNLCGAAETDEDTKELKLVPVWLDELSDDSGYVIFLDCPDLVYESRYSDNINKSNTEYVIGLGETEKQTEFFDKIYIGFWKGGTIYGTEVHPSIDSVDFISGSDYRAGESLDITLLNDNRYMNNLVLDKSLKYTFKFLADDIPNPRALFYIYGKKYVCEKLTATFTENGMSQLIKGDFYQVADD